MEINKKVFLLALIVFFLLFAGMFFWQQKSIRQLEIAVSQFRNSQSEKMNATSAKQAISENKVKIIEKQQKEEKINFISGIIKNVSNSSLEIDADVPDWERMKQIAASPELSKEYQNKMAPTIKKTYVVAISSETKFVKNNLSSIKAGDRAYISSKENANETDQLTAVEIVSPDVSPILPL